MKNKHLLLLFLLTLLLGLAAPYFPWFRSEVFQTDLMRIDSARLKQISIVLPGQPELLLERSDEGWVVSQDELAVRTADSSVAPMLASLARIRSLRIVHSRQLDTLSLLPTQAIHVETTLQNGQKEVFDIGREIWENSQPATFIALSRHQGIYLTDHHLRGIFTRKLADFRNKTVLNLPLEHLQSFRIFRPGLDTVSFQQRDSAGLWTSSRFPDEVIQPIALQQWRRFLLQLNGLEFADHFDESRESDHHLKIRIEFSWMAVEEPGWLQVFSTAMMPEGNRPGSPKHQFVLQSSQNTFNYFALSDTSLLQKIGIGPLVSVAE